jgi:nucleoid DNA-binding protein
MKIKKKYNTSNDDATIIVEAFLQTIQELAQVNGGVIVQNLGKFEFKSKIIEKYVRDFQTQTGEIKRILKSDIYFTPSKTLRDL